MNAPAPFTLPLTNPFLTHSIKQYADSFYPYPIYWHWTAHRGCTLLFGNLCLSG